MDPAGADLANQHLVERMIAEGSLASPPLIAAFRATPRHRFLDRVFVYRRRSERWKEMLRRKSEAEQLRLLYDDKALITRLSPEPAVPISSSSQPSLMAEMLHDLQLAPGLRVLEIGTGTGYNAALLAHVVGAGRVVSVDVDDTVLAQARDHLRDFSERGIRLVHADGRAGFAEAAPYDRIIVTAATPDLEPAWLEQLAPQGMLVAPLVLAPGLEFVARGTVAEGVFDGRLMRAAYFMPLRSEGDSASAASLLPPDATETATVSAPWADWFERCRPLDWLGFSQALALLALLRGLEVHHRSPDGSPLFGVVEPNTRHWCWLGDKEWQTSDAAGQQLGESLWRAFLDLGGPRATHYRLQAGPAALPEMPGAYLRQGPRCWQRWELVDGRERAD